MHTYQLTHLADCTLLHELGLLVTQDRSTTASLLACLAEVDERKLYLPAACSSMYMYCVRELRMSEDTAFRRIAVARTARQFPAIFAALADGRLNMTSVLLLTPHLTPGTADELLAAAALKTKDEIRLLLAERFPQADVPTMLREIVPAATDNDQAMWEVVPSNSADARDPLGLLALERVVPSPEPNLATRMEPVSPRARLAPLAPGRFALQLTLDQETHDLLRYAQELLGHDVPSGDVAEVLKRALGAYVQKLEQQKFARASRPGPRRSAAKGRYIPTDIRRTVWQRDGGRCTFVSSNGQRCDARTRLEYDHSDPVARGGATTARQLRLRCRAHNQYAAECAFGVGFMQNKRQQAKCAAASAKALAEANAKPDAVANDLDVTPWLRQLGFTAQEARRGAALCADIPDAALDHRMRVALRGLAPASVRRTAPMVGGAP